MELGESLEQAAARELFEETGLKANHFTFINLLSGEDFYFTYPNGDEVYNVIAVYIADGIRGEMVSMDGESDDLRFFSINDLPTPLDARAEFILEQYSKER